MRFKRTINTKQSLDCFVSQMKSVLSQTIVSAGLGLTVEGVVLIHNSVVVAAVGQVDLGLDQVGSLVECKLLGLLLLRFINLLHRRSLLYWWSLLC